MVVADSPMIVNIGRRHKTAFSDRFYEFRRTTDTRDMVQASIIFYYNSLIYIQ